MNSPLKQDQVTTPQEQMASVNATTQSADFLQAIEAFAHDQASSTALSALPRNFQDQVNNVLANAKAFIDDWHENEGRNDPDCKAAVAAYEAVKPLLTQHALMIHLLVRAAAEINGNPFLDDDSALPEIRQFLRQSEIASVLPEVIFDIAPDQVEIVDELLGRDSDDPGQSAGGCFIRAADSQKVASVMMSDVIGEYDTPDEVPEWAWVEENSIMAHRKNGESDGIWEFMLNMAREYHDVPAKLLPVLNEARSKGVAYLLFHQGT